MATLRFFTFAVVALVKIHGSNILPGPRERRRLGCVWKPWLHKMVCSDVAANPSTEPGGPTAHGPLLPARQSQDDSSYPSTEPGGTISAGVLPPTQQPPNPFPSSPGPHLNASLELRYDDKTGKLIGNASDGQIDASLRIFRRTVLLLGPLPHVERQARALLCRHYSRYFAHLIYVFVEDNSNASKATCNTDYIPCSDWPNREVCWLRMIQLLHTAAHEPHKLEQDKSLLSTAPRLRRLALSHVGSNESHFRHNLPFDGFFYAHADLWINPLTTIAHFSLGANVQHKFWFPRHRCFGEFAKSTMTGSKQGDLNKGVEKIKERRRKRPANGTKYPWGNMENLGQFGCRGWADLLYFPVSGTFDFVEIMSSFAGVFHEVSIPSAETLLAMSHGEEHLVCAGEPGFGRNNAAALPWEKKHMPSLAATFKNRMAKDEVARRVAHASTETSNRMLTQSCGHRWSLQDEHQAGILLNTILKIPPREQQKNPLVDCLVSAIFAGENLP